jgi:hypothetical protein
MRAVVCSVVAIALMTTAVQGQPAVTRAGIGETIESAIVLPNIADEFHGVAAEHGYIAEHFPTWHILNQATIEQNGRRYDLLGMTRPGLPPTTIYFDITPWFGK